jgi:signal transduction histidine kinase
MIVDDHDLYRSRHPYLPTTHRFGAVPMTNVLSPAGSTAAARGDDLAALRHELCSPLAAVTALIGTLAADDSDRVLSGERRREIAQLAYWQARHMAAVLSGIGNGTRALIEVVVAAGVAAGVPEPRLRTELTPDAATTAVNAHPVQQILTNLLGNAVRHGAPDTEIRLAARLDGATLVLTIHNRMVGPYRQRPEGCGLRIVDSILNDAHGSFLMRRTSGWMVAEATLPVLTSTPAV